MNCFIEIHIDDLEIKTKELPAGTILVCEHDDNIYIHTCYAENNKKPAWNKLTSKRELLNKFDAMSIAEKANWFLKQN